MADRRKEGTGILSIIPDHVLDILFQFFTYQELIYISSVSAVFYLFCNEETLWQDIFMRDTNSTFTFNGSWKHMMLQKNKKTTKELTLPKLLHFEGMFSMFLYSRWYRAHVSVGDFGNDKGDIERKNAAEFSGEDFQKNYDAVARPVLICGATDSWKAHTNWTRENLAKTWGDTEFKVSERGSRKFKMTMNDYLRYLELEHDEEMLYIFDSGFAERAPEMLQDYEIPQKYFPDDFFELLGRHKPSFRWFVMGPPRSGAPWHVDPAGTSAWNALLHGKKRWLLYPPGGMPPGVMPQFIKGEHVFISPSSIRWLLEVYPSLEEKDKPIECVQNPGEIIYVPGGWWHMVLNLTESIAVTQNFANEHNFTNVCEDFYGERRDVYEYYKKKLLESRPEYAPKFVEFENSIDEVTSDFDDIEFWGPYIKQLLKSHNLPDPEMDDIQFLSDGTNPVFLVNDMVIKFYSKRCGGERSFLGETGMYKCALSSPISELCPRLLGHGKIDVRQVIKKRKKKHSSIMMDDNEIQVPNGADEVNGTGHTDDAEKEKSLEGKEVNGKDTNECNGKDKEEKEEVYCSTFPYLVMTYIEGSNIMTAREEEMKIDMAEVAVFLAHNLATVHAFNVERDKTVTPYDEYLKFLTERRAKAVRAHSLWGTLPVGLVQQIERYLPTDLHGLVFEGHVLPIHGDITDENVIGVEVDDTKKGKAKGRKGKPKAKSTSKLWKPKYMLDFGDARQGDIAYELVSLFISVFECKKEFLEVFFKNYSFPNGSGTLWEYYVQNKDKMVKKLMTSTLLHECDALRTAVDHVPTLVECKNMDEFAVALWEI